MVRAFSNDGWNSAAALRAMTLCTSSSALLTKYPNPARQKSRHWKPVMPISEMASLTSRSFAESAGSECSAARRSSEERGLESGVEPAEEVSRAT